MRPNVSSPRAPPRKRQRMSSPTYDVQMEDLSQEDIDGLEEIEFRLSQAGTSSSQAAPFPGGSSRTQSESPPRPSPPRPSAGKPSTSLFTPASTLRNGTSSAKAGPSFDSENPFLTASSQLKRSRETFSQARGSPGLSSDDEDLPLSQSHRKASQGGLGQSVALGSSGFTSASRLGPTISGFTTATHVPQLSSQSYREQRSPSPDGTPPDFSAWFSTTTVPGITGFASAGSISAGADAFPIAFTTAAQSKILAPSATALQEAEARMKQWNAEDEEVLAPSPSGSGSQGQLRRTNPSSPPRQALRLMNNAFIPDTPTPRAGNSFTRSAMPIPSPSFQTAAMSDVKGKASVKPFKSPVISRPSVFNRPSPPNPTTPFSAQKTTPRRNEPPVAFTPARSFRPLVADTPQPIAGPSFATPVRQAASFATPPRLGVTPRAANGQVKTQKKFVTPFKNGMRPGEPGRTQLEQKLSYERPTASVRIVTAGSISPGKRSVGKSARRRFFDLKSYPGRITLATSGLWPGAHSTNHLEAVGINTAELAQITPETALYYVFYNPYGRGQTELDSTAALVELQSLGCSLVTKEWVDNHWGLILWKLAGMVCLDPGRERDMDARRWSWDEVMRQLRYRYEKELNGGSRPALRLITTQDSPASSPMVLCISNIFWSESGVTSDGLAIAACPELEVTDGWYKLRATVDPPLARAIERGAVRVGRKIAVAGAKLSTGKSEPCEVLDAYETVQLSLSGNSAHLAPWHAKLGFTNGPCVSTLHSLTPDGGPVQMLDLIVTKAYPIAFLEFIEDENGNKTREGPRKEKEEMEIHEQWRKRRDAEEARLRQDFETKMSVYQGWAEKLEQKARRFFPSDDDSPPDDIEDIFDDLDGGGDYHQATAHLTNNQAGWLARYIHERSIKERESINEEIERDLKVICPPRDVRNFRVLFMKDAHTDRRPSHRTAEITVWDVLSLSFDEGRQPGTFKEGQRFLVSNLLPSQHGAWMPTTGDDPHIYLSTRRDSRWRRL